MIHRRPHCDLLVVLALCLCLAPCAGCTGRTNDNDASDDDDDDSSGPDDATGDDDSAAGDDDSAGGDDDTSGQDDDTGDDDSAGGDDDSAGGDDDTGDDDTGDDDTGDDDTGDDDTGDDDTGDDDTVPVGTPSCPPDDVYEPNNAEGVAFPMGSNSFDITNAINCPDPHASSGDQDWYSFEVACGDSISTLTTYNPSEGGVSTLITLSLDVAGGATDFSFGSGTLTAGTTHSFGAGVAPVECSGKHYILVDSLGALDPGAPGAPYEVSVTLSPNTSLADTDSNGVPDMCENLPDADGDGTPDHCDPNP